MVRFKARVLLRTAIITHKVLLKLFPTAMDIEYEVGYTDGIGDAKFFSSPGMKLG
jgi:hypothetical protein